MTSSGSTEPTGRKATLIPTIAGAMGVRVRLGSLLRETNNRQLARRIGTDKRSCGLKTTCRVVFRSETLRSIERMCFLAGVFGSFDCRSAKADRPEPGLGGSGYSHPRRLIIMENLPFSTKCDDGNLSQLGFTTPSRSHWEDVARCCRRQRVCPSSFEMLR